jgi:hypothetical protein
MTVMSHLFIPPKTVRFTIYYNKYQPIGLNGAGFEPRGMKFEKVIADSPD